MSHLTVNLGERSYKIHISSTFNELKGLLVSYKKRKALIITDSNVEKFYTQPCIKKLKDAGLEVFKFVFSAGEKSKNLETIKDIYSFCKNNGFERKDIIIALGGGVVGDIAGFVSATYLRGIGFVQVPTSVIAQCDSSIGGKVGVDFEGGKNLIGAFYQPEVVYINVRTLKTLPEREYISGFGEIVKHAIIQDKQFFKYLEQNIKEIKQRDEKILSYIVKKNCELKAKVVEQDEKENGIRAILNFGHTIGHAIESVLDFLLLHGECVSMGIISVCNISVLMGLIKKEEVERIKQLLENLGLPVEYKNIDVDKVYNQMFLDKKISGGKLNFILPKEIGEVKQCDRVPEQIIKEVITKLDK